MLPLECIVYVSSAARPVNEADLVHLIERARARNKRCEVTGLLLFDAGNFMQYIEGPRSGLSEVFERIKRDPLHTGLIELCHEQINRRAFGEWTMAARVFEAGGQVRNVVCDMNPGFDANLLPAAHGSAGILLQGFWQRSQHTRTG